jgi:hypothetical protein
VLAELREHRKTERVVFVSVEVPLMLGVAFCMYWLTHHPRETNNVSCCSRAASASARAAPSKSFAAS